MSTESAKAFFNRITEDEAFNTQYQNASSDKERRKFITSAGYSFTFEEWETIIAESNSSEDELSDKELTEVSGGIGSRRRSHSKPPKPSPTIPDPIDLDL